MKGVKVLAILLVVVILAASGGFYAAKWTTNRWFANHKICYSNEPIILSTATFTPSPMTGTATEVTLNNGEMVVSIDYDGKVHFGKGITPDKASRAFWKKMGQDLKKCGAKRYR